MCVYVLLSMCSCIIGYVTIIMNPTMQREAPAKALQIETRSYVACTPKGCGAVQVDGEVCCVLRHENFVEACSQPSYES